MTMIVRKTGLSMLMILGFILVFPAQYLKAEEQVRRYDTRAIEAYMEGLSFESAGELSQALNAYLRAYHLDRQSTDILFALARLYLQTQQVEEAYNTLQEIRTLQPRNIEALELLGRIAYASGRQEEAIEYYDKILALDYDNEFALLQSAEIYRDKGDSLREADYLVRLWELDNNRVAALSRAEQIYLNANDYKKIVGLYDKLIKRMPTRADLVERQIRFYLGMNQFFEAEFLMDSLIGVAPWSKELQSLKTDLVKVMHGEMAAVDYLTSVVEAYPDTWELKLKLGQLLIDAGDSINARPILRELLETRPDLANAVSMLVWTYLDVDDLEMAYKTLMKYLPAYPEDFFLHRLLGSILHDWAIAEQDSVLFQEALTAQKNALKLKPKDQQTLHLLANTLEVMGKDPEVLMIYEQIIDEYPDDDLALNNYAYMLVSGEVDEDILRYAAQLVEKALSINPENAAYLDTAGWIYFKLGHARLAYDFIERSLNMDPNNPEVLRHMGDILEFLGKTNEAYIYYMRADQLK